MRVSTVSALLARSGFLALRTDPHSQMQGGLGAVEPLRRQAQELPRAWLVLGRHCSRVLSSCWLPIVVARSSHLDSLICHPGSRWNMLAEDRWC